MSQEAIPGRFPAAFGDIAADAMDPMMEMVLGSRLTFSAQLDPAVLGRATRLLLDLEPILGSWWDETRWGADWVRCASLRDRDVFSIVESDDPDSDAAAFHAIAFDPKGPRVAVHLLRSTQHDDLCVRFDHVVGDGWSVKEVTCMLAETYGRLLADPGYVPTPKTAPRPTHAEVWAALTDDQRAAAADSPRPGASTWTMKLAKGEGAGFVDRTFTLAPERVAAIRAYSHARGATVNDALVAAMLRAAALISAPKARVTPGISISADTRRFALGRDLDRLANIATTQNVSIKYVHGESFDDTLRHVTEAVKPYKECLWTVGAGLTGKPMSASVARPMFAFMAAMMKVLHVAAIVNMNVGALDEHRLAFGDALPVRAYVTGPILRSTGFATLVSYYRDAITLWTGTRREIMHPESIERYLSGIETELADAVLSAVTGKAGTA